MLAIGKCSVCDGYFSDDAPCFSTIQYSVYYYCPECRNVPPAPLVCVSCHEAGHTACVNDGTELILHRPRPSREGIVIMH